VLRVFALVVAACGDDDATTTTTAATRPCCSHYDHSCETTTAAPTAIKPSGDRLAVSTTAFNASAWAGVQAAVAGVARDSFYLESDDSTDWQPNIDQMLAQDCQHIVTVGFALGEVTAINAQAHPEITWTMIDNVLTDASFAPLALPNVRELVYQTDQAAFAAGYLAAGVSQTGVLCTYGGCNFPTVSIFMDGSTVVPYYNEVKARTSPSSDGTRGQGRIFTGPSRTWVWREHRRGPVPGGLRRSSRSVAHQPARR
jgi:basic membrane protein A